MRWLRFRKYSESKIVQRVDLFFSHYYRILVLLYELEQRCLGPCSFDPPHSEIKATTKRLRHQLRKNNFEGLNKYSTGGLIWTLQLMLKDLPQPLLTGSSSLFRRWMEMGEYLVQAVEEEWEDLFPDLVIHLARFMAVHTKVYELLVLERLMLVCRHLATRPPLTRRADSPSSSPPAPRLCPSTAHRLACLYAPCILMRPRRFGLSACRDRLPEDLCVERSVQIFLFLFYNIHEIFGSDNQALLKGIPLALRKYWQKPKDGGGRGTPLGDLHVRHCRNNIKKIGQND